jgi:hypothetical protein
MELGFEKCLGFLWSLASRMKSFWIFALEFGVWKKAWHVALALQSFELRYLDEWNSFTYLASKYYYAI